jgi:hypothetical protein
LGQVWIVCSLTIALHGVLGNRGSIRLAEDRDYLLVGVSALPHRLFLRVGEPSFKKSTVRKNRAGQSRYVSSGLMRLGLICCELHTTHHRRT